MFDRLRYGYYLLLFMAAADLAIAFPLGVAGVSTYVSTNGLTRNLLPAFSLFPAFWAASIAVSLIKRRVDHPLRAMKSMIYRNRKWLLRCVVLSIMMILMARAVTSYKTSIPSINPYWADPIFVSMDHLIFGNDPWKLTHYFIGERGTVIIDRIYAMWFMVMMITLGWFCFSRNPKIQLRGLLTSLLCWTVLSNFFATIFASVGPCYYKAFYRDSRYDALMNKLSQINDDNNLFSSRAMKFLLDSYGKDIFGAGISAMPSLHVAMAVVLLCAVWTYSRQLWLKILIGLYASIIFIGSIHLGWHYAVDGIVSIVAGTFFWWATGRYVDWLDARDKACVVSAPPLNSLPASA